MLSNDKSYVVKNQKNQAVRDRKGWQNREQAKRASNESASNKRASNERA